MTASLRRPMAVLGAGFKSRALISASAVAGGMFAQTFLRGQIAARIPATATGIPSIATGLATSGLMLLVPKVGREMFAGALGYEVGMLLKPFVQRFIPTLRAIGEYVETGAGMNEYYEGGMSDGMSDDLEGMEDMDEYVEVGDINSAELDAANMFK